MDTDLQELSVGNDKSLTERDFAAINGIYNRYVKRIISFVLALVLLIVLLPVYLIIAIAIVAESGFSVFYRGERGGYRGKSFRIFKFRTMVKNAELIGGGTTALNDSRITRVGKFLRKTKLDEIAQLINIIKGEMCFVGPRPELKRYTDMYKDYELYILQVRPGITDFSSLEFINLDEIVGQENADQMYEEHVLRRKNQLRVYYAMNVSFVTDVKLFFKTIGKVFKKTYRLLFQR